MLPRRRFLALLGLAPVAVPAALAAAVRPAEPFLVEGVENGVDPVQMSIAVHDFASGRLRTIASAANATFEDVARDLETFERVRSALRVTIADEVDPYPSPIRPETASRGSAGVVADAVRTSPLGRFLPTTGRGLRAPVLLGVDPAGPSSPSAWAWAGLQNQAPGVRLPPAVPSVGRA